MPDELDAWKCPDCHGEGLVRLEREGVDWRDIVITKEHCDACDGIGWQGPDAKRAAEQGVVTEPAVVLWQAMNEAEKVGNRTDDKLIVEFLRRAGYCIAPLAATPAAPPRSDEADRLLREVFALCEATEDAPEVEAKNEHQAGFERGRRFEAKRIRRGIGTWFQDEFCGRSFMGEPVAATPAPAEPVALNAVKVYSNRAATPAAAEQQLGNLLSLIHRDGGQYIAEHGLEKAIADAEAKVIDLLHQPAAPAPLTEPPPGLLMSMAIRYDHGLGMPGLYDSEFYRARGGATHQQRLESTLRTMRQLWEEVVGHGFYRPEREASYAAMAGQGKEAAR